MGKKQFILSDYQNIEVLRQIASGLWCLLDDLDTASDQIKPANEAGYKAFYEYVMKQVPKRHHHMVSDGYKLFIYHKEVDYPWSPCNCDFCEAYHEEQEAPE